MTSYVYGCGPCCEWNSRHSSLLGRMAEAMGHALQALCQRGQIVCGNKSVKGWKLMEKVKALYRNSLTSFDCRQAPLL
jgi:hypothetical protein